MVARFLLPLSPSDPLHLLDRTIASARPRSPSRHSCGLGRWHHDGRAARTSDIVEGDRVIGRVPRDAGDAAVDGCDQSDGSRRVIDRRIRQGVSDNDTGSINTQMKLLPASPTVPSVFRGSPFPFAQNRQPRAIDNQMHAFAGRDSIKPEVELLTTPGERRVIGRGELEAHHLEERLQEPLGLAEGSVVATTEDRAIPVSGTLRPQDSCTNATKCRDESSLRLSSTPEKGQLETRQPSRVVDCRPPLVEEERNQDDLS